MIHIEGYWDDVAKLLRREIEGYGCLFAVLEGQRSHLIQHDLEGILQANTELEAQANQLNDFRSERMNRVRELCGQHGLVGSDSELTVRALVRVAPQEYQAMFESIIKEIERLILETSRYLKRNQMLLRRAYEYGQYFLSAFNPESASGPAYQRNGFVAGGTRRAVHSSYLKRA